MSVRVDRLVTAGTFSLDGGTWEVENNVWIIGDDSDCVIVDAPHDPTAILEAVAGRTVRALLLTHAHDDHIRAARAVAAGTGAPIHLHPADRMLWDAVYPEAAPDVDLHDGDSLTVGGTALTALHTPGHSPGSTCFYAESLGVVFTGDTLFNGGPGATGRSYSDFPTIVRSITERLLSLPPETTVLTGHGDSTTIGAEAPGIRAL
ncbi:MBL fold metallo-hydrolase [Specibacter sp. RAF43]|uniref:MBL fold metallo-hydrolase n=1 Tax=Specibacter sp. RAF43 TaxID=3233057 RepID=UPI003F96A901